MREGEGGEAREGGRERGRGREGEGGEGGREGGSRSCSAAFPAAAGGGGLPGARVGATSEAGVPQHQNHPWVLLVK